MKVTISLMIIFALLEYKFGNKKYSLFSNDRKEDSLWFLLNEFLYPFLLGGISFNLGLWFEKHLRMNHLAWDISEKTAWVQFVFFMLLMDCISFIFHYAIHKYNFLWDFHKVHHTTTELTFLSSFRSSWSNNVLQGLFYGVTTSWLAVNENVRMWGNIIFILICMFQHINVKIIFPKILEHIFVTPKNHFWHHSKIKHFPFGQNFGLILTVWDHAFKTYYNPDHFNTEIGLSENYKYSSFFSKLIYPIDKWIAGLIDKTRNFLKN